MALKTRSLWAVALWCLLTAVPEATAQTVVLVRGAGVLPPNVVKGASIRAPNIIQVPAGAIVVLEETWRSDVPGLPCTSLVVVSGGSYRVKTLTATGTCPVADAGDALTRARGGESLVATAVFYGDAKSDGFEPEKVVRSRAANAALMRELDQLSRDPR